MFFRKKQKVDLDAKFKEVYHEVNKITADAGNELDVTIKYSQLKLACRKYDELIDLIHQGANFASNASTYSNADLGAVSRPSKNA